MIFNQSYFSRLTRLKLKMLIGVTCILLVCTFYWDLVTLKILYGAQKYSIFRESKPFGWEWVCDEEVQQCSRQSKGKSNNGMSFTTCLMTCGPPQIWPIPTGTLSLSNTTFSFHLNQIQIHTVRPKHKAVQDLLLACVGLFKENVKLLSEDTSLLPDVPKVIVSINVTGSISDVRFRLNSDESYRLIVSRNNSSVYVALHSLTYLGVRHGLETLLQLIWWDEESKCLKIIDKVTIQDRPYYTYRGLHLDTSSHFIPIDTIKRTIEGMSINKLNVFHWHMSDTYSFPFYSTKYNKMSMYGAYSSKEIYTPEDLKTISEFAEIRGIHVSVEIDSPGHAGLGWNFDSTYGNLTLCLDSELSNQYCVQPPCGFINPSNGNVYKILQDLYSEITNITGVSDFTHIGGDLEDVRCWESSEEVTELEVYVKKGVVGVWEFYETTLAESLSVLKNGPNNFIIEWDNPQESLSIDFINPIDYIVQMRGESSQSVIEKLVSKKFRVIISNSDKWYLNLFPHWETVYNYRPWAYLEHPQTEFVIGGEACVWTERIDSHSLDPTMWPLASAFAERLWSDPKEPAMDSVMTRLSFHRERMVKRGISAAVLGPKWCLHNPTSCS